MRHNVSYGHDTVGYVCTRCGLKVPEPRPRKCVCGMAVPRADSEIEASSKPFPWQYVWGPLGFALAAGITAFAASELGLW